MINKETYKDIGKAYKTCLTDNVSQLTVTFLLIFQGKH